MANRPNLITGPRVLVYINGKLFGKIVSFQWGSATPRKKIRTIDIPHPVELAATTVDMNWNMSVLRLIGDGGAQGAGIVAQQTLLSREKYFTILIIERTTNTTLFRADFCNTDNESWVIQAKDIMRGTINGSGITWVNEGAQQ
jgi:hypothetical protein